VLKVNISTQLQIFFLTIIITPDIPEAEKIVCMKISSISDMETTVRKIHAMSSAATVIKSGRLINFGQSVQRFHCRLQLSAVSI
jgi:hydroxymethylpyrimidine/phosphomethylpyrimidine kinase